MWTEEELKKIKFKLPKDKYLRINKILLDRNMKTVAESTIRNVLNGKRKNEYIILAAIQAGNEYQEFLEEQKSKI